ncbi:MAG: NDP-sugar synthase [Proteobacteria bacterium]|nr:NDP-sugar synthase [Pseudomonadota bacterium]
MTSGPLAGLPALVLGAGFGTRLAPLTEHIPKPVIPVLGRPLIGHPLIHLYASGCTDVWVNAHHKIERLQASLDPWLQRRLLKLRVGWSLEQPEILGTAGALKKLEPELRRTGEPILMLNGDSILGLDLPGLVAAHRRNREQGALATLLCLADPRADSFGALRVNAEGRILERTGLGGLPDATEADLAATTPTIFCGVHVIEPELLDFLPPAGEYGCIVRQGYVPLMQTRSVDLRAHFAEPDMLFHDVGTPERYLDAQADLMAPGGERALSVAPGVDARGALFQEASYAVEADGTEHGSPDVVPGLAGAVLNPPFFFGPANRVEAGARIGPNATIGAGNVIGAGATVTDAALWSRVEVGAGERIEGKVAAFLGGERHVLDGRPA